MTGASYPLEALIERLGHPFRDRALLWRALTHRSWTNEHPGEEDNEPLAFLGDAVLQLVVTERLWRELPGASVGILTPRRASLVSGAALAAGSGRVDLGRWLRLGRGEEASGGRAKESVLATALEAVLGAAYLDGGMAAVQRVVAACALW